MPTPAEPPQGITCFSNLAAVQFTRNQSLIAGGGRIRPKLDFLSLITEGDESQNIPLFDRRWLASARAMSFCGSNSYKQARPTSAFDQAINLAGGTRLLKGKVKFIRFTRKDEIERRVFSYNNPILMAGDIFRVRDIALSAGIGLRKEIASQY